MSLKVRNWKIAAGVGLLATLAVPLGFAQDRDADRMRDRDWDANRGIYTRIAPGTVVPVRLNESIDVDRGDNRVYHGEVADDVRGQNGRIAIARGSAAELMVRVARDNDLILDLESVVVNGNRYAVRTEASRVESSNPGLVGAIVGAVTGADVRGRTVRIPRGAVVSFRLDRPLELGVRDAGVDRDGHHYHDWYGHDHQ
jgi:hypothetical protein